MARSLPFLTPAILTLLLLSSVFADNRKLIETLLENEQLTEEQAAELLAEQPVTARTAGSNFKDFRIRGRIQAQAGFVHSKDADRRENYSTLEMRRIFLGFQGTLLQNVRAQAEINVVPGSDFHLRSAFLQWREHQQAFIKFGFDRPLFGAEHTTSSAEILTIERSTTTQTIAPKDTLGLALDGHLSDFGYGIGIYTNRDNANPSNQGRYLYNLSASKKLSALLPENQHLTLRADLLFNDDSHGLNQTNKPNFIYKNGAALSAHYQWNPFDLRAEFLHASGFDSNSLHGWYLMPSFYLTEKLQLVARFEQLRSDSPTGLRSPSRYIRRAIDRTGNRFNAFHIGTNYYFNGDSHKLMFGAELSELTTTANGHLNSTTLYTAWRVLF